MGVHLLHGAQPRVDVDGDLKLNKPRWQLYDAATRVEAPMILAETGKAIIIIIQSLQLQKGEAARRKKKTLKTRCMIGMVLRVVVQTTLRLGAKAVFHSAFLNHFPSSATICTWPETVVEPQVLKCLS